MKTFFLFFLWLAAASKAAETARWLPAVPATERTELYPSNRAPLAVSPLVKLPIGSITPRGWLHQMLLLEANGMAGHLEELSPWLVFSTSAWAHPDGEGDHPGEELPYWLRGYGDLGYVLNDPKITAEAAKWLDAIIATQREDGYFGPRSLLTANERTHGPDLWPHMPVLNALQSFYERTGDRRVIDLLTRYFRWEDTLPAADFDAARWARMRMGDNIESIYWLYNRTGETSLLGLAQKIFDHSARWDKGIAVWHNVDIAQGFRTPTVFWMQSAQPELLAGAQRNYDRVMSVYGQFPGGGFAGDEMARPGFTDPRQGFETCGMVEFMHSFEMLTKVTGGADWADRCEEVAFNSLPAALTADEKALHYLTGANMVQLDAGNKGPGLANGGTMLSYSPNEVYRCCQHNHTIGWPYYAEELWLATSDRGLCASLYAASDVTAKVADGREITFAEETAYPFGDSVTLRLTKGAGATFPLYLRVPKWCAAPGVEINGQAAAIKGFNSGGYLVLDRAWRAGDAVTLHLPMEVNVRHWPKNKDAVSVERGPIEYSLKIAEQDRPSGQTSAQWPEHEVYSASAWNYGLARDDAKAFTVVTHPASDQPFTPASAPVELKAPARKIDAWQQDDRGLLTPLQQSPARTSEPIEEVSLIPMGAARLRISEFPIASDAPTATEWKAPVRLATLPFTPSASWCFAQDTVDALCDGDIPQSSDDQNLRRMTWWDHRGTAEWAQYTFKAPATLSSASVYWFDDRPSNGDCRVPASWRLMYQKGADWAPVTLVGANLQFGVARDGWNAVTFEPVETTALRLEVQLQSGESAGVLEWKVN